MPTKIDYEKYFDENQYDRLGRLRGLLVVLWKCLPAVTDSVIYPSLEEINRIYDMIMHDIQYIKYVLDNNDTVRMGPEIQAMWKTTENNSARPWHYDISVSEGREWCIRFFQVALAIGLGEMELMALNDEQIREGVEDYVKQNVFLDWHSSYVAYVRDAEELNATIMKIVSKDEDNAPKRFKK